MQPLAFIVTAGVGVWFIVYLFVTDGSAIAATVMACAAMFAVLMLKIRETEGIAQRMDPVRQSSITPRSGVPEGAESRYTDAATPFHPTPNPGYATPYSLPTEANPLMNVLPPNGGEYGNRPPAAPSFSRKVEQRINDAVVQGVAGKGMVEGDPGPDPDNSVRSKLYMDLGGEINLSTSMQRFTSNPATTTPNDQTGFAEFCYGTVGTCARGGELFCVPEPAGHPHAGNDGEGRHAPYHTTGTDILQQHPEHPDHAGGHDALAFQTTRARARATHH